MTLDLYQLHHVVDEFYGNQPTPQDVTFMHGQLQALELSPAEFEQSWRIARPIATRLLGRDPTLHELKQLSTQHPEEYHRFYGAHPHPDFPEVKASEMAKYHHIAEPIAMKLAGRKPVTKELARFALGGYHADDVASHYGGEW